MSYLFLKKNITLSAEEIIDKFSSLLKSKERNYE
jgi:hypothetical protein